MVKRTHSIYFEKFRTWMYTFFALAMLMMCWESSMVNAAIVAPTIPEDAIRIRIISNSDSLEDQWLKGQVRKAVTASLGDWIGQPDSIEEAREVIREHIPQIREKVGQTLDELGYSQHFEVELGQVPFPAKVFGNQAYPAGEYEALRITLGDGKGTNWWCVLYPPLCLFGVNKAQQESAGDTHSRAANAQVSKVQSDSGVVDAGEHGKDALGQETDTMEVELRFFIVDMFKKIAGWFKA